MTTPDFTDAAERLYETAYKSLPPVDLGSANARGVIVPAIAVALREAYERGRAEENEACAQLAEFD